MTELSVHLLTAKAAEYLRIHCNSFFKWATRDVIPVHRNALNGYRLFNRKDLDQRLKETAQSVEQIKNRKEH